MVMTRVKAALLAGALVSSLTGVGPVATLVVSEAQAQAPRRVENVAFTAGTANFRIPRIEVEGGAMSQRDLDALFDARAGEPWSTRFNRIDAKRIVIPELVYEQKIKDDTQTTTYRNLVLTDVTRGKAASMKLDGARIVSTGTSDKALNGEMGAMEVTDVDLVAFVRLYTERSGGQAGERIRIHGPFTLAGMSFTDPKGVAMRIGRVSATDFFARTTSESWGEIVAFMSSIDDPAEASDADRARLFKLVGELAGSFDMSRLEVEGMEVKDPAQNVTVKTGRITYAGEPKEGRIEAIAVEGPDGRASIGAISLSGFSFAPMFNGLAEVGALSPAEMDPEALRKIIPTIGTLKLSGLDFDVPDERAGAPKRIRFTIGEVELTADRPINGIPTNLRIATTGFKLPIAPGTTEDGLKDLADMGYTGLDLSWALSATWLEGSNEVAVREISIGGRDMGTARLKGTFGNVTRDAFANDSSVALVALIGAVLKNLELTVENNGLAERLLAWDAKRQGKSVNDLRRDYGIAASIGIPAALGNSPPARAIGQAVAKFVAKPGKLVITAKPKDAAGLGFADLAAVGDPKAVLEKFEITATAE
jgi:hypothetical protein